MHAHMAKVTIPPGGEFPLDMLRYDNCFPCRTGDALNLAGCSTEEREVYVARYSDSKRDARWTPRRWKSFCVQFELVETLPPTLPATG